MGQNTSAEILQRATLVDTLESPDTGELEVWKNQAKADSYLLKKNIARLKSLYSKREMALLLEAERRAPATILPLIISPEQAGSLDRMTEFVLEISSNSLQTEVERLNAENASMNEVDLLAIVGSLLKAACVLESHLDFHKSICLQNVFLSDDGSIRLLNQYLKDSHLEDFVRNIVRPVIRLGDRWREEYWTSRELRLKAAGLSREVELLVQAHREQCLEMVLSIGLVGLCLATGKNDHFYLDRDRKIDRQKVAEALGVGFRDSGDRAGLQSGRRRGAARAARLSGLPSDALRVRQSPRRQAAAGHLRLHAREPLLDRSRDPPGRPPRAPRTAGQETAPNILRTPSPTPGSSPPEPVAGPAQALRRADRPQDGRQTVDRHAQVERKARLQRTHRVAPAERLEPRGRLVDRELEAGRETGRRRSQPRAPEEVLDGAEPLFQESQLEACESGLFSQALLEPPHPALSAGPARPQRRLEPSQKTQRSPVSRGRLEEYNPARPVGGRVRLAHEAHHA